MFFGPKELAPKSADVGVQINDLIDTALEDEQARQKPRGYLGGSRVGLECHRQLAYEYFSGKENRAAWEVAWRYHNDVYIYPEEEVPFYHRTPHSFDGGILRIFALGHIIEDEVARLLRLAGFILHTEKANGAQFGWGTAPDPETGEQRMKGHADGVVEAGPVDLPYPLLWECKSMKDKKWKEVVSRGVEKAFPVYFGQMQTYMAYMELRSALFTSYNKDTSELYIEIVPFDPLKAQHYTDRAVRVLQAQSPEELPRVTNDMSDWRCRFCDFKDRCWNEPKAVSAPAPNWIKGADNG